MTRDRHALLQEKEESIAKELERWTKKLDILRPGEQIVFRLDIRPVTTVIRAESKDFLEMAPLDFFTKERFRAAGVVIKGNFARIENLLRRCKVASEQRARREEQSWKLTRCPDVPTVKILAAFDRKDLYDIPEVGKTTVDTIRKILAFNGIPFIED